MSAMKRFWPLFLIVAGVVLILGGILYYAVTEGLPDQDPTPAMAARAAHHEHISSFISLSGLVMFIVGVVSGIVRFIVRRFRPAATL